MKAGEARITVTFRLNESAKLEVTVQDLQQRNNTRRITVSAVVGQTSEEAKQTPECFNCTTNSKLP